MSEDPVRPRKLRVTMDKPVFLGGAALIFIFVALTLLNLEDAESFFASAKEMMVVSFGWFLVLTVNIILIGVIWLGYGRYGKMRLGPPGEKPEFSTLAWLAMLFSAGMGIGLLYYGVAEPLFHYASPPMAQPETVEAAREAMAVSVLHWGLHPWAVYSLVAMALAFSCYRRGLPLTPAAIFEPLIGDRIHRWPGKVINIVALLGTLFGVATSLGFGAQQVNGGLHDVLNVPVTVRVQIMLIAGITALATLSVVLGLSRGILRFSMFNIAVAALLVVIVFVFGPTRSILDMFVQDLGAAASRFIELSTWTESYKGEESSWQHDWTLFYWAWWIAWSPFVGLFIARISKGRTLREFVTGVLFLPTILSVAWFTVFGGTALQLEMAGVANLVDDANESVEQALFALFGALDFPKIVSVIAILAIIGFFVTSSDSGSLVIDIISAGGHLDPPKWQRVFWAVTEGVVASVLLLGGGLTALQTGAITTGLPIALLLLFALWALVRALGREKAAWEVEHAAEKAEQSQSSSSGGY